ncbi:RNA polymerase sigma factor [Actinospica durhamensis]|uniref:RNA polymerase sigma factor n=1 Tax=Actinospica durhamensis TaxID=1508375 RepID=A0A941IQ29_9ACTN|nr:RNA polymerase sigma factor [Actinospica durhamensis]MBR7833757.1 RNA polymerase sigma factor [Actinospica durhamensis]
MSLPREGPAEQVLWRDALSGSVDAWNELFVRHHQAIYNFCFRRVGSWTAAEDLASTVFLEAWRRRGEVAPEIVTALPWLYGIATMLTRNHYRTMRRYREALARIPPPEPENDPAETVALRVDAERRARVLVSVLSRLAREDREVLELAATERLSHAEIGMALGIPVGTVKSRLSRARRRLAERMESEPERGPRRGGRRTDSVEGGPDEHRDMVASRTADAARPVRGTPAGTDT